MLRLRRKQPERFTAADARLAILLFAAREWAAMLADIVEEQSGDPRAAHKIRRFITDIDAYRTERGWDLEGDGDDG